MSDALPPLLAWSGRTDGREAAAPLRLGDRDVAGLIGWGGLEIRDPGVDLLELCAVYARAVRDFSCGQCIPCRVGSTVLADLLESLRAGCADDATLAHIAAIAEVMANTSRCDVGRTSPRVILSVLDRLERSHRSRGGAATEGSGPGPFVYRSMLTAPCVQACPLHIDIPRYVEHIGNGRFREALDTIEERLPFAGVVGRVCVKPCESSCRRGLLDGPIQIRHLKRFAADRAGALAKRGAVGAPRGPPRAPVAVIGAGPAGLTCAWALAGAGHPVTVFDRLPRAGGMLSAVLPGYRLPLDVLDREVKAIEELGVRLVCGQALGRDFTLSQLRRQGFQAVFLAVGTHGATTLALEGDRSARGVWECLDFLHRAKHGQEIAVGRKVAVVGGGSVAIDVARTARRLGAAEVRIVYRRTRRQMRALPWEIQEAIDEGVSVEECWAPRKILSGGGRVRGIEVERSSFCQGRGAGRGDEKQDGSPPPSPPRSGGEGRGEEGRVRERKAFEADTIVFATGMGVDASFRKGVEGLELLPDGRVQADPLTLRTSVEGVFAGGDCVTGPNVVVQACAHGLLAAFQIARRLAGREVEPRAESLEETLLAQLRTHDPADAPAVPRGAGRIAVAQEPVLERTRDFREVEAGFTAAEAVAEASRCLRCYRVVTCAYRA